MSKRTVYDDDLYAHFVTFSCYKRRRLLDHDRAKKIVIGTLESQRRLASARCVGFVVMPNHVHAILWCSEPNCLSHFMKQWKHQSSIAIRRLLTEHLTSFASQFPEDDPIWQRRYYPFHLYTDKKLREKLKYMHDNPVRAGLVSNAADWQWSSAPWYELGRSVGVAIEWAD